MHPVDAIPMPAVGVDPGDHRSASRVGRRTPEQRVYYDPGTVQSAASAVCPRPYLRRKLRAAVCRSATIIRAQGVTTKVHQPRGQVNASADMLCPIAADS